MGAEVYEYEMESPQAAGSHLMLKYSRFFNDNAANFPFRVGRWGLF